MKYNKMWKDIEGYENLYQINEMGEVKGKRGFLKPNIGKNGYKYVSLCKNSKHKSYNIHKLLANHFLEKVEGKNYVDHIDRNKLNNSLDNLRFVTCKENNNNTISVLNRKGYLQITKDKYKDKIYTWYRVFYYEDNKKKSKRFRTKEEAEEFQKTILPFYQR